ncbi:hypothetical protein SUSAZ_02710 [Sulfolobus acidocaldarius SUSAZ]|nr:hypothetical protein SUSAZ_02710 [Sulfolobus acidocaldarius SUSAZ]
MFPFPRRKKLSVVLFTSIFDTEKKFEEIIYKLGFIIRTLVIFRVSEVIWLDDLKNKKTIIRIIKDVGNYALTPPYGKKYIPIKRTLSKVGLIPPINIPSHVVSNDYVEGEIRKVVNSDTGVKIVNKKTKSVLVLDSLRKSHLTYDFYPYYDGYSIKFYDATYLNKIKDLENVIIASRSGKDPSLVADKILSIYEQNGLTLVIGPPKGGLLKMMETTSHMLVNFVPKQGVKDVRAEEALYGALSLLNYILR